MSRIDDKIKEIKNYLDELGQSLPSSLEQYKNDFRVRAICERYFEKIVEAVIDLAFLTIKKEIPETPESDKEAFDILVEREVITEELATEGR